MQQPKSIERFEQIFFLSVVIGLAMVILTWNQSMETFQQTPALAQAGPALLIGMTAVTYGVWILLWWLIARRGSEVAKWFYVVLFVLEVVLVIAGALLAGLVPSDAMPKVDMLNRVAQIVTLVLGAASVWFLFQPDTRPWFNKGIDPNA